MPERILGGKPYPINALLLFATNPLANHPAKEAFAEALKRVPFVVSFSPILDESSMMADLILPDHTYLERWQDDQVTHLAGFTCFSVARPAATPLYQTRNTADVVLQLAKGLVEEAVKQEGKKALPPRDPACSGARNQPWLLEQPAVHVDVSWEGWVESAKGRIQLKAKLYAGTLPNVVHIPLFGGQGPNPNDLIANEADPFRGFGLFSTTRVRIRKA